MSPLMRSECRKFAPNIFNKTKCTNCFRQKEEHSAEALESNRATRKVCKCGYLFVAPDWDFSNPINRTKRWQRRWFVLYDDGELTYSVDEHPDTVPQAVISLLGTSGQGGGGIVWEAPESETGHPHSLAVAGPDRVHFVRGDTKDETRAWLASLLAVASPIPSQGTTRVRQARHKRNATFPGGRSNPMSMGVAQRVISGTTAVSGQHSPVLRQRFNSCISPLHHALPLEVNEGDIVSKHRPHSNPICKTSSSTTISPDGSSDVLLENRSTVDTSLSSCHSMLRLQVTGETPVSRSYFIGVDSSSAYCKEVEPKDVFLRSVQCHLTPNERLSTVRSEVEQDPKLTRPFRGEVISLGSETSKCSLMNPWRKYNSALEERQTSLVSNIPLEKNVRGDPDGCVLDPVSTSSFCSVEGIEQIDGLAIEHETQPAQANDVVACDGRGAADSCSEQHVAKDLSHQWPIRQEFIKHGWLMKLGSSKEWSKHWFVLRGNGLLYYRDPSAEGIGILDGVIDLGLVQDVRDVAVERNHGLQLTTWDGKQCVLSAVTPGIRSGWVAALRKAAGLSCLPQKPASPVYSDQSSASVEISILDTGQLPLQCISENSSHIDPTLPSSDEPSNILSLPVHVALSSNSKLDVAKTGQSPLGSPFGHSNGIAINPSQVIPKGQANESKGVSDYRQEKSKILCSSICNENFSQVEDNVASRTMQEVECLPKENVLSNCSSLVLPNSPKFPFESKVLQDKNCTIISTTSNISVDPSQNTSVLSCVSTSYQGCGARSTTHKPPLSPAFISSCSRNRRHSLSNCVRQPGSQTIDKSSTSCLLLESNTSDCVRAERPSYLSLKSLPSSISRESRFAATSGYAPATYISSSASSCSLSDEDFRTASEASLHSTPISEVMVDSNSNSILWPKAEIVSDRVETSNTYLSTDAGGDLGAILPPSPPLNRTPISRVKERARSRVIKRSKTPPEEDHQSVKIESLTKRVKELVSALAAKEAELLKEKSKEVFTATLKKRSMNEVFESKSKVLSLVGDGGNETMIAARQNTEEDAGTISICSQVIDNTRMNDLEDNNHPMGTSVRRLSSSLVTPHSLPRMGSLSDLTNVDLDLDLSTVDHERLAEEWCGLRARFEKAVREIHALRKELRACQGHVDALELESSATSMCLAEERKRAEADMSLMANRVQDLTVKLSAAEKQVRQLKQKASRVESREKRRSLSLRGDRDVRSGTDPSLGTGKLPKEISDRLTRLEACLAAAIGHSSKELVELSSAGLKISSRKTANESKVNEKIPQVVNTVVVLPSADDTMQKGGNNSELTLALTTSVKNSKGCFQVQTTSEDTSKLGNAHLNSDRQTVKSDSNIDNKGCLEGFEVGDKTEVEKSNMSVQKNPETWTKVIASCPGSEQRKMRAQGRRQRLNSRVIRRAAEEDTSHIESVSVAEEEVEELKVDDDSSKGCDPLRILVRLGSLEGRVADYLKTNKIGKKLPSTNTTLIEFSTSEIKKSQGIEKVSDDLCPRCEEMRLAMERMKKELLLVNHGISCRSEEQYAPQVKESLMQDGGSTLLERYREEIEQLRVLCEKGMRAMDLSHQRLVKEMEEKHREEVVRVQIEKEQALREETKATLAALDAMRKAHETEVQREVAKFKEEFSRRMSSKQELSTNHQVEMEGIRREILSLSQRYSSKCVECASLREQLMLAKGLNDKEQAAESETSVEVLSGNS